MKEIFKNIFSMWFQLPYKEMLNILFWSCKLYLLVLAPYLTTLLMSILLSILFGGFFDVISSIPSFTRAYFYDGYLSNLIAWRVHLTWFTLCFLVCLNEEFS